MSEINDRSDDRLYGGTVGTAPEPESVLLPGHDVPLGRYTTVRRLLPQRELRMVGAWCFVDHFGPEDVSGRPGMQVPPHPHTGLQTVSWLLEGSVHHRDSLGSDVTFGPRELPLMTAGLGIAHSEQSPVSHPRLLHGVQLWVVLPDAVRDRPPAFEHHASLPGFTSDGLTATVLVGDFGGERSAATTHTPLVGVDLELIPGSEVEVPLEPGFEYGVLASAGAAEVEGVPIATGAMLYLGTGRRSLRLRGGATVDGSPTRLMLLGGEPFDERIVMWWNFVGRSGEEIVDYAEQWNAESDRFGAVVGYDGNRLEAPPLPPVPLKARGRQR